MLPLQVDAGVSQEFQSAPGQLAGRCVAKDGRVIAIEVFQSAPGQLAGRCEVQLAGAGALIEFQSAPGQLAGRCGRPGRFPSAS